MNITKIVTKSAGLKGLEVHYIKIDEQKGKIGEKHKAEFKRPIQLNLENKFRDLRYFLLEIAGVLDGSEMKMQKDYAISDCKVTAVGIEDGGFYLVGDNASVVDYKRMKLETPVITEDDEYVNFEAVKGIIAAIVEETELYMDNKVVIDNDELVERWVKSGNDNSVNNEAYDNMSSEEKKQYHIKVLEKQFGVFVLDAGDPVDLGEEVLKEEEEGFGEIEAKEEAPKFVEEEKNEFLIGEEEIVIPVKLNK